MAKYLFEATYTAEGLQGLAKDKASGRFKSVSGAIKKMGGKLESFYYAFGKTDVYLIVDLPDNSTAAALALAVGSSGLVHVRTTPLLTVADVDKALDKKVGYRAPGN
jgi:uncharacterized protein with GYD domain